MGFPPSIQFCFNVVLQISSCLGGAFDASYVQQASADVPFASKGFCALLSPHLFYHGPIANHGIQVDAAARQSYPDEAAAIAHLRPHVEKKDKVFLIYHVPYRLFH